MNDPGKQVTDASSGRQTGGPREFLAAAYDACADGLYRYALMLLTDPAAAEDAVHQAFAKLVRMDRGVLEIESCRHYLRTAVRNECWRTIERRRRRPREIDAASAMHLLEANSPSPVDEDERARLEAALRALPAEQREVIHMKVYEGKTFQQIADLLDLSINTVASRHRYAMDKLRQSLACEHGEQGGPHDTK